MRSTSHDKDTNNKTRHQHHNSPHNAKNNETEYHPTHDQTLETSIDKDFHRNERSYKPRMDMPSYLLDTPEDDILPGRGQDESLEGIKHTAPFAPGAGGEVGGDGQS